MRQTLRDCWNAVIKRYFKKGLITYERQLQAYLFMELHHVLRDYVIWVEPNVFVPDKKIDGKKPDLVITLKNEIVAFIELKCTLWSYPHFKHDLNKLKHFENLAQEGNIKIPLSWHPDNEYAKELPNHKGVLEDRADYGIAKDCLFVFGVIGRAGGDAISGKLLEHADDISEFLHLRCVVSDLVN